MFSSAVRRPINPPWQILAAVVSLVMFLPCGVSQSHAESGEVATVGGKKHGLRMTIDSRWPDGPGYRPIRIRIEPFPPGPSPFDRTLQVTVSADGSFGYYEGNLSGLSVSKEIVLERGQSFVEKTISVPCDGMWNSWDASVRENGKELHDLSYSGYGNTNYYYDEVEPTDNVTTLVVSSTKLADNPAPSDNGSASSGSPSAQSTILELKESLALHLKPAELPTRWIDYSSIDIIVMPMADARLLATAHPRRWRAVCKWLATGTTLRIAGDIESDKQRAEIDKLLMLSAGKSASARAATSPAPAAAWKKVIPEWADTSLEAADKPTTLTERSFGLGTVQHSGASLPPLHTPLSTEANWTHRHGISLDESRDGMDFLQHMIPGVGMPPVNMFRVLITLFVIVIGPVNYLFLRRRRRLYLLLVSVPLASIGVTASLFAFALVSDGIGTRARVESLTHIDQRSGHVTAWSRQTYYAAIAPSGGLTFPGDTTVYPISADDGRRGYGPWGRQGQSLGLDWNHNQQKLYRGFIKSRVTAQFLVTSSRTTGRRLDIQSPTDTNDSLSVTNRLGCHIRRLLVCDANGILYSAENIAPKSKFEPTITAWADVSSAWRRDYWESQTSPKTGYLVYEDASLSGQPAPNAKYLALGKEGILGRGILMAMLADRSASPHTYVAIVSTSVEVTLGIKDATEEASFHLITGSW